MPATGGKERGGGGRREREQTAVFDGFSRNETSKFTLFRVARGARTMTFRLSPRLTTLFLLAPGRSVEESDDLSTGIAEESGEFELENRVVPSFRICGSVEKREKRGAKLRWRCSLQNFASAALRHYQRVARLSRVNRRGKDNATKHRTKSGFTVGWARFHSQRGVPVPPRSAGCFERRVNDNVLKPAGREGRGEGVKTGRR